MSPSDFEEEPSITIHVPLDRIDSFTRQLYADYLGYGMEDIAEDFELLPADVVDALKFEGMTPHFDRQSLWAS